MRTHVFCMGLCLLTSLHIVFSNVKTFSYVVISQIDKVGFSFKIYQSTIVKKTKPASITVYDYYETRK